MVLRVKVITAAVNSCERLKWSMVCFKVSSIMKRITECKSVIKSGEENKIMGVVGVLTLKNASKYGFSSLIKNIVSNIFVEH